MNDAAFRPTLREFVLGDDHWPCRWDEHVAGWILRNKHPNLIWLRYEDMHQDTASSLTRVLEFIGIRHQRADVDRAVEAARFDRMKSLEDDMRARGQKFGVVESNPAGADMNERFVRRGQVGTAKEELDPESLRRLEQRYETVMRAVGYLPSA